MTQKIISEIAKCSSEDLNNWLNLRKDVKQQTSKDFLKVVHKVDPNGLFCAKDASGESVGFVAVYSASDDGTMKHATFHIVKPALHNKKIGTQLWNFATKNALPENQNAFIVVGIPHLKLYRDRYHFGDCIAPVTLHYIRPGVPSLEMLSLELPKDATLVYVNPDSDVETAVLNYDAKVVGYRRIKLLKEIFQEQDTEVKALVNHKNAILGYGVVSTDVYGLAFLRIVFADSEALAETLILHLLKDNEAAKEKGVTGLLVTKENEESQIGMKLFLECIPMVKIVYRYKEPGNVCYDKQFVTFC